jgi:glycosyltransferase involved in cell wall biosynthesis
MTESSRLPAVLVVEDRAHLPVGHWPVLFAEVAGGFAAVGCRVAVLTSRGWYFAGEKAVPFPVYEYGWVARAFDWLADLLQRSRRSRRWRAWLRRAGEVLRVVVITRAAATRAHVVGDDTVVVVVSNVDAPELVGAIGGRGRWLSYVYFSPRRPTTFIGASGHQVVRRVAAMTERYRRARQGCSVVGAPSISLRDEWAHAWPGADVRIASLPGGGEAQSIDDARDQLDIDPSLRVALLFGMRYEEKDPDTVFDAFSELDDWNLVVAGTLADDPPWSARVFRRYPGYVDNRTRALLFSAADLVVISYHPGFMRNSGNLREAITWNVPVVCSDRSATADVVRAHRLGTLFEAGNAASLARAVRAAPTSIDPADLARVRAERSSRATAEQALQALGALK